MKYPLPVGAILLKGDIHTDEAHLASLVAGHRFDAVVDYIAFTPHDIERDLRLFRDRADQFVFISSASAYQKPVKNYLITEETPLENPYWEYSRNKIACEQLLMREYHEGGFPVTIIRPSLTYGPLQIPFCVGSWLHPWTVIDRMKRGQKIMVPGDGTSLWVLTWNADFAKGLVGLLGNEKAIGEAFQITSDQVRSWDQIYLEAYQALGLEPNVIHIASDLIARFDDHAVGSLIGDKSNSVVFGQQFPQVQVLALTSFKEGKLINDMLEAGAIGYLLKDVTADELARAIRAAHAGRATLSPDAAQALVENANEPPPPGMDLTNREREVLALMIDGLNNTQIAARLTVSPSTVKSHVSSILSKLGVASRTEAVSLALRNQIVS